MGRGRARRRRRRAAAGRPRRHRADARRDDLPRRDAPGLGAGAGRELRHPGDERPAPRLRRVARRPAATPGRRAGQCGRRGDAGPEVPADDAGRAARRRDRGLRPVNAPPAAGVQPERGVCRTAPGRGRRDRGGGDLEPGDVPAQDVGAHAGPGGVPGAPVAQGGHDARRLARGHDDADLHGPRLARGARNAKRGVRGMTDDDAATWANAPTARWWSALDDGRLECDLCPRRCRLHPGQRGFCFVRARDGDRMVLTTYGRSSGFAIDPVEKKPLAHFHPGTAVLSFGTAGCNLNCRFCQNWDISKSREWDRLAAVATPDGIARAAASAGCDSVAFTYNDPVIFAEYAIDTAVACHELGLHAIAVTSGYITAQARAEFFGPMDAANIDLKGFTEDFYWKLTGSHLRDVLDTIGWVHEHTDTWLELTTLLIPGYNDARDEVQRMCRWILAELGPDVPLHLVARVVVAGDEQGGQLEPGVGVLMHPPDRVEHVAQVRAGQLPVEVLGEALEVDVRGIHRREELGARLRGDVPRGDRDGVQAQLVARHGGVDRVLGEDHRVVVGERHRVATRGRGGPGDAVGCGDGGEPVPLAGLGDVPVLAEPAVQVAAGGAERQHGGARVEVREGLLLHRVDGEAGAAAVRGQHHPVTVAGTHEAEPPLSGVQPAAPWAQVALQAPVVQGGPPSGGRGVRPRRQVVVRHAAHPAPGASGTSGASCQTRAV